MVIGNGLMAKTFDEFRNDGSVIIFASGVSNSLETSDAEYEREKKLLKFIMENLDQNSTLVYFSTCSIFDSSLADTPYIIHKKQIEKSISTQVPNYIIFRLPVVVSRSSNPNTLINFIFNKIVQHEPFQLHRNAFRYLIDIEDAYSIISSIIKYKIVKNRVVDIVLSHPIPVTSIVEHFKNISGKEIKYELVNKGEKYDINNAELFSLLSEIGLLKPPDNYYKTIINKYYKTKLLRYDI